MIDEEEIPQNNEVTYLIEPAPQVQENVEKEDQQENKTVGGEDASVVFCIDCSSSMNMRGSGSQLSRF